MSADREITWREMSEMVARLRPARRTRHEVIVPADKAEGFAAGFREMEVNAEARKAFFDALFERMDAEERFLEQGPEDGREQGICEGI